MHYWKSFFKSFKIKRRSDDIIYAIGRRIYRFLVSNRSPLFQKCAVKILSYLLSQESELELSLKKFASVQTEIEQYAWIDIPNAMVTAGSRLIVKNDKAFIPSLQNKDLRKQLDNFKLQEEAQIMLRVNRTTGSVFSRPTLSSGVVEGKCFSTLSSFSESWVHWLFEIFPQLLHLSKRADKDDIKILVETEAPFQIYETITAFFPVKNIVKIPLREQITCRNLLVLNNEERSWSVLWGRRVQDKLTETYHHDMEALKEIRRTVYKRFSISDAEPEQKVFIRRKALFRFIHNEQELADYLFAKEYKVIEPSIMSFQEQVECFSNTRIIVAQAGASLANIIFMKPGSTVVCMAAKSDFLNYDYFLSIAQALGISFKYVLGKVDDDKKYSYRKHLSIRHPLNASFTIDKNELVSILSGELQ